MSKPSPLSVFKLKPLSLALLERPKINADEIITEYIEKFKSMCKVKNGDGTTSDIMVPKPWSFVSSGHEFIMLGDLFEDIYNKFKPLVNATEPIVGVPTIEYVFNKETHDQLTEHQQLPENIPEPYKSSLASPIGSDAPQVGLLTRDAQDLKQPPTVISSNRGREHNGVLNRSISGESDTYNYRHVSDTVYKYPVINVTSKQYCFFQTDADFIKGFLAALHEICMQYYAFNLIQFNAVAAAHVVVPEIYSIQFDFIADLGKCMAFYMETIEKRKLNEAEVTKTFFNKWKPIITNTFGYFGKNNLAHLDTSPNNVYFTGTGANDLKLCIIDFGEAIMPETETVRLSLRDSVGVSPANPRTSAASSPEFFTESTDVFAFGKKHAPADFVVNRYAKTTGIQKKLTLKNFKEWVLNPPKEQKDQHHSEFWGGVQRKTRKQKRRKNRRTRTSRKTK